MKINAEWHKAHRMPKNPTEQQRAEWHIAHSEACNCREMPDSIRELIARNSKTSGPRP